MRATPKHWLPPRDVNSRWSRQFRRLWWCDEVASAQATKRGSSRRLHKTATAIRQVGGSLEDVQATLEFLIDRRKMLTELDSQIPQLIEDDDELVADVEEAADVFMAAERAVKWCQSKIKEMSLQARAVQQLHQVAV